jgi:hypothetical protein
VAALKADHHESDRQPEIGAVYPPDSSYARFFRGVFVSGGKNMTKRSLLLLGVLAMVTLPIASAKSYDIAFSSATMVGNTQLPVGEYTLKVEGPNAVITNDVDNYKSVTAPVKIENVDKKVRRDSG